jgi:hypothetical protein
MRKNQPAPFGTLAQQRLHFVGQGGATPDREGFFQKILNGAMVAANFAQGARQGGIVGGLANVGQLHNIRQYNRYQAGQEAQAAQEEAMAKAQEAELQAMILKRSNPQYDFSGGFHGPLDTVKAALDNQGVYESNTAANDMIQGHVPTLGGSIPVPEALALGKLYQQRRAEGLDAGATNAVAMPMMVQGQGFFNQAIRGPNANWMNPNNLQAPPVHQAKEGLLMPSPILQGGVSAQGAAPDPFSQGIVDPKIMQGYLGKGVDAAKEVVSAQQAQYGLGQKDRQLSEMIRSNRADEGLGWYNAKTGRISATKPTGGGSSATQGKEAAGSKEARQNLAFLTKQRAVLLSQLRSAGFVENGVIKEHEAMKNDTAGFTLRRLKQLDAQINGAGLNAGSAETLLNKAAPSFGVNWLMQGGV